LLLPPTEAAVPPVVAAGRRERRHLLVVRSIGPRRSGRPPDGPTTTVMLAISTKRTPYTIDPTTVRWTTASSSLPDGGPMSWRPSPA
jgi:hypothetical protein